MMLKSRAPGRGRKRPRILPKNGPCSKRRRGSDRLSDPAAIFGGMQSLRGQLLISGGGLYDPNFRHTVVLIGEHNEEGALGVVLNRALGVTVRQAIPELADLVPPDALLHQGGPVRPTSPVLLAELADPSEADLLVFGSIGFLVGEVSPEIRPRLIRARVFAGYAGWGAGQLEAEMEAGGWILEPARPEDVFTDAPDSLWSGVLTRKGGPYRTLAKHPFDPSMN
jgi:putative transcriptional regulator